MQLSIIMFFAFVCLNLQAQDCPKYNKAMQAGNYYLKDKNYDSALVQFQVAQIAARECDITTDKPALELKKVFEGLKHQRDEAIQAKKEAERAKQKAINSQIETKRALKVAEAEKRRADSALAKADKLNNAFYFYNGKFALALKQINNKNKYGFINREGKAVIDYKYDKAKQFDYTGFARVIKRYKNKVSDYLVDTTGKEYKVAYQLSDLNSDKEIVALDLRGLHLDSFPKAILTFDKILILILNQNAIKKFPVEMGQLKALQILFFARNQLTTLPAEIGQLKALQTLDLSRNQLTALPAEIVQLQSLQTLNLSGNQLTTLPAEIGQLKALQTLDLSGNSISISELQQLRSSLPNCTIYSDD